MAMMNSIMDMNSFRQPWNTQPFAPVNQNFVTPPVSPAPPMPEAAPPPAQGQGGIPEMLMKPKTQVNPGDTGAPGVPPTGAAPADGGMLGSIMKMFGGGAGGAGAGGAGGAAGGAGAAMGGMPGGFDPATLAQMAMMFI